MIARTPNEDLKGTVSADINDLFTGPKRFKIDSLLNYIKLDKRFKLVGIQISGTDELDVYLICVDNNKSSDIKEHIVKIPYNNNGKLNILEILFKQLSFVLYNKNDIKYSRMEIDEDIKYEDFH